jgi:NAD(P)-dependent dehydrogenase (short-subunit alcohol dehydrogenase family)
MTLSLWRLGPPDDTARVAVIRVSDMAAYMAGSMVVVDGGNMVLG